MSYLDDVVFRMGARVDLGAAYRLAERAAVRRTEIETDQRSRHPRAPILREYGLTVSAYDALVAKHEGKCGGCGQSFGDAGFVVDHCHVTRKVRGLLHPNCNSSLGMAHDNPATLRALAAYLEKSRE
jgi:hypothetical protein